jgi:hypothetical protein
MKVSCSLSESLYIKSYSQQNISEDIGSYSQSKALIKGTVSRDFFLLVFFMNQFPPSPRVFHLDRFKFFQKFAEIFASQGAPPVSTTPVKFFYHFCLCC